MGNCTSTTEKQIASLLQKICSADIEIVKNALDTILADPATSQGKIAVAGKLSRGLGSEIKSEVKNVPLPSLPSS